MYHALAAVPRPAPLAVRYSLPPDTAAFTGRDEELARIAVRSADVPGIAGSVPGPGRGTAMYALCGMPGVGKTALAVHAGHLLAGLFPDRQLFVDLHGHTPGQRPADPADALAALLAADGVDPRSVPAALEERAAMWRDRLAGKRVLLILDNAASSDQVTPLLPGTADCLVLVTSRGYLGDLPAGVTGLLLDTLPARDAEAMFVLLAPRAAGEPERVAQAAALCACLPLAILLLARMFSRHDSWSMDDLIGPTRARLLTVSAENRTVAAAFELSYQYLAAPRRRIFRYLGLHPGADFDRYAAAALTGLPLDQAAGHLDGLQADHLLSEPVPGRYRMHDLIRQYARSLAADEPAGEREQAIGRLLDYYQYTAEAADAHLARYTRSAVSTPVAAPPDAPSFPGRAQAQAWLTAERANLLVAIDYATARREDARVVGLTAAISAYLRHSGLWPLAVTLHSAAAAAAARLGDRRGEANALCHLGYIRQVTGEYRDAITTLERALAMSRDTGDQLGQANALNILGSVRRLMGDYQEAIQALEPAQVIYRESGIKSGEAITFLFLGEVRRLTGDYAGSATALEKARDISRDIEDQVGEVTALTCLAALQQMTGDYPGATAALEQARDVYRDIGNRPGEGHALLYLGETRRLAGEYEGAGAALQQAMDIYRDHGSRPAQANAQCYLGAVRYLTGDYPGAAAALQQALDTFRDLGDRPGEAEALNHVGTMYLIRGEPQRAVRHYEEALGIARAIVSQLEEARALEGIGKCYRARGQARAASDTLMQALAIYQRLGAAEALRLAAEIRGR